MTLDVRERDPQRQFEAQEGSAIWSSDAHSTVDHEPAPSITVPSGELTSNNQGTTAKVSGDPPQAASAPTGQTESNAADAPRGGILRRHKMRFAIGGATALIALVAGGLYWDNARHYQSTDDAFIAARQFSISPKVSGYIASVPVTDNQHVGVGAVLAGIDPRDYQVALAKAQAEIASAQASIKNYDAQLTVQQSQIESNRAQVEQAQASLTFAEQQASRYGDLAKTGSGTIQNAQQYSSQLLQAKATLQAAQANFKVAQQTLGTLQAQRDAAVASLAQANAQRDQAELNLSYTTVTAAQAGRVTNLSAATGQFAQAGTALAMFVPDEIWVTANYKETQLDQMRPGQSVSLQIDAYPGQTLSGYVASIQSGSGTAFSLLPPENATGNYVKVVQRVPVKIVIDNPPKDLALGPGMSVVPVVRVADAPSLYERLRRTL